MYRLFFQSLYVILWRSSDFRWRCCLVLFFGHGFLFNVLEMVSVFVVLDFVAVACLFFSMSFLYDCFFCSLLLNIFLFSSFWAQNSGNRLASRPAMHPTSCHTYSRYAHLAHLTAKYKNKNVNSQVVVSHLPVVEA